MNEPSSSIWKHNFLPRLSPVRFLRWLFSWRMVRRYLFCLACLATLIALFYAEENWRGKHAWEKYKHEWEAKGEKFDLQAFIPAPVPDDQNFATTPFLAEMFDFNPAPRKQGQSIWRNTNALTLTDGFSLGKAAPKSSGFWAKGELTDLAAWVVCFQTGKDAPSPVKSSLTRTQAATEVLRAMDKFKPVLTELQTASHRSYARFNIQYNEPSGPWDILLPHLALMKRSCTILQLRSSAELALGQSEQALQDTEMVFYLGDAIKNEPFLISGLVHLAIVQIGLQPIWEGLAEHQWSDAQLAELTQQLEKIDLMEKYGATLRGERALNIAGVDYMRLGRKNDEFAGIVVMPSGWLYQNQLAFARLYQARILPVLDAANHRAYPSNVLSDALLDKELRHGFPPYNIFAKLLYPAIAHSSIKYAAAQTKLDEAVLACALERYRLAHGEFPETLDSLSPQFIAHIPHDLFTGEPLKYHRTDDGRFVLYSIGWNGKDDGGKVVMIKTSDSSRVDPTQGDWVWPLYPAP